MNYKNIISDSGSYVSGQYQTKNGFTGSGLNCPRGTSLYDTSVVPAIIFLPQDRKDGEEFMVIKPDVVQNIAPYYLISNYGNVYNFRSEKYMKENYRPNGYGYFCFATTEINEKGKIKQRKGTTHRIIMETFEPRKDCGQMEVNHIDGNKTNNIYNVHLNDGTVINNLEWVTPEENIKHAVKNGLKPHYFKDKNSRRNRAVTMDDARNIRKLHEEGYSIKQINEIYPNISSTAIQNIYTNRTYKEKE